MFDSCRRSRSNSGSFGSSSITSTCDVGFVILSNVSSIKLFHGTNRPELATVQQIQHQPGTNANAILPPLAHPPTVEGDA